MSRHDEIQNSYKTLGKVGTMYDGIVTRSPLLGKLMDSLIWGLDKDAAAKWINDALAPIPTDFGGSLLEVPVGTGVLTMPLYKSLPNAASRWKSAPQAIPLPKNTSTITELLRSVSMSRS